jgi:hypothetical protein
MKRLVFLAVFLGVFLALTTVTRFAHAAGQDIRACEFEVKPRCASGDARVTISHGAVTRVEVNVYWCALHGRAAPPFACTIDSSRTDKDAVWTEDAGAILIANGSPFNPNEPDRVKVTVGHDVSIDLSETQSLGRCGAGAELPQSIVIPAQESIAGDYLRRVVARSDSDEAIQP